MSIPMSWISSANISSRRDITCDSDDFVLVHEDLAQLLACREQVWAVLGGVVAIELHRSLGDVPGDPQGG